MARRSTFAAAAAAALLLCAAGCKPSSLTPLGIGTRGPDAAGTGVNGIWEGTTSSGGSVSFQVGDDRVTVFAIRDSTGGCSRSLDSATDADIVDGAFSLEMTVTQGQAVVTGRFTSSDTCAGSYSYQGLPTEGSCPTSGSVSFTAGKTP